MKKEENKPLTIRFNEKTYKKIVKKADKEDRSYNYIVVKMVEEKVPKFDNDIYLNKDTLKEMKECCEKLNISIEDLIEKMWRAYKKTYR